MTRILPISDVHAEFHADAGRSFVDSLAPADVLILAGDIGMDKNGSLHSAVDYFCEKYPDVVYVAGNHEYGGMRRRDFERSIGAIDAGHSNFHWLNNSSVTINGQRFVGTTLWYPDDPYNVVYADLMYDFRAIPGLVDWVYEENRTAVEFLNSTVMPEDVVVTHHVPHEILSKPQWKSSPLNRFFVGAVPYETCTTPRLWIYGHTHDSTDTVIDGTRFICNPFGYAQHGLNREFREDLVLET